LDDPIRRELVGLIPRLRRFAYGLTGSADEGDDLVQAACEKALTRLDQYQAGTRLDSWMYRIVQTVWIDRVRARRRRGTAADPEELDQIAGGNLSRETEARLMLAKVQGAMSRLPDEQRAVLLLISVEGVSYKEAAEILDVPMGTVMSRLARARASLAKTVGYES